MKKVKENIKKVVSVIKKLRKTEKGKAILFFGFYFFFFLFIAIIARINPGYNGTSDVNNETSSNISFSLIEQANYSFNYSINVDGVIYNYIGNRNNNSELFTLNGVNYYKIDDDYYTNASGNWLMTQNPYVFKEFLNIDKINSVFGNATLVSKTEYETGEISYSYKILSASIIEKLEGIPIDIEEIPNDVILSTRDGEINKIQLVLNSYGIYKKICNNTFTITLDYSNFGKVSEIVSPID